MTLRHLVLVLGDQLDGESAAFDGFDSARDAILMMEVRHEADYIPQHRLRLAYFFSCMRHFCAGQRALGREVIYSELDAIDNAGSFGPEIARHVACRSPEKIIVLEPGDWRVRDLLRTTFPDIELRDDRHFLCSRQMFEAFAAQHPALILEHFYRFMRRKLGILMEPDGEPSGGAWNFDKENRASFGRKGPPLIPSPPSFPPDDITRRVLVLVEREFPDNPGKLDAFDLPVTREQARQELDDFVQYRLQDFGRYQDAMYSGQPLLFHSRLSGPLNLHLLRPREVIDAAVRNPAHAPLNSVEGFVRQILGWREFVRGIYWHFMPDYAGENALDADLPVPRLLWTGDTDMNCLREAVGHIVDHAYAHHIERLMVLGQFCLLLGVRPYDVHRWHISMFWDAIDWVSLPNTLGMSQHGDGGRTATKPYAASGAYINRMSDYCRHCRYKPQQSVGDDACPFTTLYWDFLDRHHQRFAANARMKYHYVNLARKDAGELAMIRARAAALKREFTATTFLAE
jgi:deoxyribodipyrimidine photolyase-related protein